MRKVMKSENSTDSAEIQDYKKIREIIENELSLENYTAKELSGINSEYLGKFCFLPINASRNCDSIWIRHNVRDCLSTRACSGWN